MRVSSAAVHIRQFGEAGISLITLAPDVFSPSGFNPTRHAAPYTAISRYAKGRLFLITTPLENGWAYRFDYPYYSWAETIVRPRIQRRNFSQLLTNLNQLERERERVGEWKLDHSEMTSAVKFLGIDGTLAASTLAPDAVAKIVRAEMISGEASAATVSV